MKTVFRWIHLSCFMFMSYDVFQQRRHFSFELLTWFHLNNCLRCKQLILSNISQKGEFTRFPLYWNAHSQDTLITIKWISVNGKTAQGILAHAVSFVDAKKECSIDRRISANAQAWRWHDDCGLDIMDKMSWTDAIFLRARTLFFLRLWVCFLINFCKTLWVLDGSLFFSFWPLLEKGFCVSVCVMHANIVAYPHAGSWHTVQSSQQYNAISLWPVKGNIIHCLVHCRLKSVLHQVGQQGVSSWGQMGRNRPEMSLLRLVFFSFRCACITWFYVLVFCSSQQTLM